MNRREFEDLCLVSFDQLISFSTVHNKTYYAVYTGVDCGDEEDGEPGYITIHDKTGRHEIAIDDIDFNTVQFHQR